MKNVVDVVVAEENRLFTGRHHELQLLRDAFHEDIHEWIIIHLYGPNGIGKSSLLRKFSRELSNDQIVYMQPDDYFRDPAHFLETLVESMISNHHQGELKPAKLDDVIQMMNRRASNEHRLLLIFDSFKYWERIQNWLFESFLPRLPLHVRLFTACSLPLYNVNNSYLDWGSLVRNVEIKPLNHTSVHEYIQKYGIHDPSLRETIARLSNGVPGALNICCRTTIENELQISPTSLTRTVNLLCQTVVDEAKLSSDQRLLLTAASLVWRFDKNMLSHIIGRELDLAEFQQFCSLPIVTVRTEGWSLLDGIRDWVRTVYKNRIPETFARYKQRAFEVLYNRWLSAKEPTKEERFVDLVYQIDNDMVKLYYYRGGHTHYETRGLSEDQLPIIEQMWREWFQEVPPFQQDHSKQEQYFRAIWTIEPAAFTTFWEQDRLAGFNVNVPLHKETREILQHNLPYRKYILHSEPTEDERLIWLGAPADKNDLETSSYIFRHFLQQFNRRKLFTLVTPIENHMLGLLSLGFVRLPWADYMSPTGLKFYVLQLDVRKNDLVHQLFDRASTTRTIPAKELHALMKQLLAQYHQLESDESFMEQLRHSGIFKIVHTDDAGTVAARARKAVQEALQEFAQKSQKNQLMCRILDLFYIKQIGTHENVADRLNLSLSTYYRHLRKAIELIATHLLNRNSDVN